MIVAEPASEFVGRLLQTDPEVIVAWTAAIECASACARRHREGTASDNDLAAALGRLRELRGHWHIAEPTPALAALAERVVVRHALRAGDAIQLASAIAAAGAGDPALEFVCFDKRLNLAAIAEGLRVVSADL
ncbi:MAG: type II toxin-antitoxin system VapC family toxin [Burkholderiales bacterium]|nr:type II toxin-antitoxin system VapC family toxin [Burkholderiales bacterium]